MTKEQKELVYDLLDSVKSLLDQTLERKDSFSSSYVLGRVSGLLDIDSVLRNLFTGSGLCD